MSTDFPFCLRMALGLSVLVVSTGMGAEAARAAAARDAAEVQLIGRAEHSAAERSAGVWQVTWPGVGWRAAFSGSRVGVTTQDSVAYAVTIDGLRMNPIPPSQTRNTTWYRGLAAGNHTIEVIRMRATPRAPGLFFGFSKGADGRWLALPPKPGRQIEFIADSASTGYGDLSTTVDCTDDEVASRSDASQSYAIVAAHMLHADWQLNAMDGIGLVRNWRGIWRGTDYSTYASRTLQSEPTPIYAAAHWHPQVAVVAIGFNDLATPLGADEAWTDASLRLALTSAYHSLLSGLRQQLGPQALLVNMTDPPSNNPGNEIFAAQVEAQRSAGDQRIFVLPMPALEHTGCFWHPSLASHRELGALLAGFIEEHGGFAGPGANAH